MLFKRRFAPDFWEKLRVGIWPRRSWSRSARYYGRRVLRLAASPHAIAAGFAAGVFASFTPLWGFHFILSFAVAFLIGGNLLSAAFGTAVGNPLTFPIFVAANLKLGNFILGSKEVVTRADIQGHFWADGFDEVYRQAITLFVGGIPLGLLSGFISYLVVRFAVSTYQENRQQRLARRRNGAEIGEQA